MWPQESMERGSIVARLDIGRHIACRSSGVRRVEKKGPDKRKTRNKSVSGGGQGWCGIGKGKAKDSKSNLGKVTFIHHRNLQDLKVRNLHRHQISDDAISGALGTQTMLHQAQLRHWGGRGTSEQRLLLMQCAVTRSTKTATADLLMAEESAFLVELSMDREAASLRVLQTCT